MSRNNFGTLHHHIAPYGFHYGNIGVTRIAHISREGHGSSTVLGLTWVAEHQGAMDEAVQPDIPIATVRLTRAGKMIINVFDGIPYKIEGTTKPEA